MTEIWMTRKI